MDISTKMPNNYEVYIYKLILTIMPSAGDEHFFQRKKNFQIFQNTNFVKFINLFIKKNSLRIYSEYEKKKNEERTKKAI